MGAILNGISLHGGLRSFGATFLVFTDYCRPAIRLSAISHIPVIWIFTHDSIGLGEDGPTHQPVEHLASLRCIPNLVVLRPGDANEVAGSFSYAIHRSNGPTLIALSRQAIPTLDGTSFEAREKVDHGGYVIKKYGNNPDLLLMATGSELQLVMQAGKALWSEGISSNIISFPSWELFKKQDKAYRNSVISPEIKFRIAVEAGTSIGWDQWIGDHGCFIGIEDRYGASAPYQQIYDEYGITVENIVKTALEMIRKQL